MHLVWFPQSCKRQDTSKSKILMEARHPLRPLAKVSLKAWIRALNTKFKTLLLMVWVPPLPHPVGERVGSWCQPVVRSDSFSLMDNLEEVLKLSRKKWRAHSVLKSGIQHHFGEEVTGSLCLSFPTIFCPPFLDCCCPKLKMEDSATCCEMWKC